MWNSCAAWQEATLQRDQLVHARHELLHRLGGPLLACRAVPPGGLIKAAMGALQRRSRSSQCRQEQRCLQRCLKSSKWLSAAASLRSCSCQPSLHPVLVL